jgi:hypothetical protein
VPQQQVQLRQLEFLMHFGNTMKEFAAKFSNHVTVETSAGVFKVAPAWCS